MSAQGLAGQGRPEGAEGELLAALYPYVGGVSLGTLAQAPSLLGRRRLALAEALGGLVASSWVTLRSANGDERYQIPEERRAVLGQQQWLQGRLQELGQAHAAWCESALAGAEEALACGPGQKGWLEHIALEQANLSAGLNFALRSGDIALAARLALGMCSFWELRGPLEEGSSVVARLLRAGPLGAGTRARLLVGLGRLLLRRCQPAAARRALRQGVALAGAERARLTLGRASAHLGLAELCSGRPAAAYAALEGALAELSKLDSPADLARCYATRALAVNALGGGPGDPLADLERAVRLQAGTGDTVGWATSRLYRSLCHLKAKRAGLALEDAQEAARAFSELGDQGGVGTSLLAAAAALSATSPACALELAELSGQLGRASGALPVPGLHDLAKTALDKARPGPLGRARQRAARGAVLSPADAIARAAQLASGGPCAEGPWAWVRALGGFQVLRDGEVLHLAPQVARLLKLVVAGGGQVHVEQAVESLWPEIAPALGKRRLRNVLSKLSVAAGPVVVREASTLRLGPGVEVDALRFEAAARQALGALSAGRGAEAIAEALAAHRLYAGELLPEDRYEDFAIVARERLSWLHLRLLDAGAAAAGEAQRHRTAEHCLRAALEIDPTDEDRYLALARHLLSRGRHGAASQVLAKAREVLSGLGLPVSPGLLQAAEVIRAQRGQC